MHCAVYLHVYVYKTDDDPTKLSFRPHFKPSSQGIVVHHSSGHPQSLHHSWPLAFDKRLAHNSSSAIAYQHAKTFFIDRMIRADLSASVIEKVKQQNDFRPRVPEQLDPSDSIFGFLPETQPAEVPRPPSPPLWLVLRAHPIWLRTKLVTVMASFANTEMARALWSLASSSVNGAPLEQPQFRVAWRNQGTHLFQQLTIL